MPAGLTPTCRASAIALRQRDLRQQRQQPHRRRRWRRHHDRRARQRHLLRRQRRRCGGRERRPGTDAVFASVNFALSANVETLVQQGTADLSGTGNALANSIFGNSGNNTLDGQGGADILTGNAGNDTFVFNVGQANGDTVVDFAGNGAAAGDSLPLRRLRRGRQLHQHRRDALAGQLQRRRLARRHHVHATPRRSTPATSCFCERGVPERPSDCAQETVASRRQALELHAERRIEPLVIEYVLRTPMRDDASRVHHDDLVEESKSEIEIVHHDDREPIASRAPPGPAPHRCGA